jgi:hypothetical protein
MTEWDGRLRKRDRTYDDMDESYAPVLPPTVNKTFMDLIDGKAQDLLGTVSLFREDPEFADIFFGEDEDVQDAVKYYERAETYIPEYKPSHTGTSIGKKTIPKAGTERMFTQIRTDLGLAPPTHPDTGNQLVAVGMWQNNLQVAQPAEKDASYDLILLSMIAQVFLNYVKSVEIEAMCIADRVVVSANSIGDIPNIQAQALADAIEKVPTSITVGSKIEELYQWQMDKHIDIQQLRARLRTGQDPTGQVLDIVTAANMYPDSYASTISTLKLIAQDTIKNVQTTPDGLGSFLTNRDYISSIILVNPLPQSHAEQNLMLGIIKSSYPTDKEISIAGGKRPCTICYLSLCLTREKFPNLRYGIRPGGLYLTETKGGLTAICNALGINEQLLQEKAAYYLDPKEYGQFISKYKDLDESGLAQAIARQGKAVTESHRQAARDIMSTDKVPREQTMILESLENQGLSSKQPTFALHPEFNRDSFGDYVEQNEMDVDDESSDEDEPTGPPDQELVYTIASAAELTGLLARAAGEDWDYVQITNADSGTRLAVAGDTSVPLRLRAGSNVAVNDQRTVVIDDDGVQVSMANGKLAMEDFHVTAVDIEGSAEAIMLTKGKSPVRIGGGVLSIKGIDKGSPATVELYGGSIQAVDHVVITKIGAGAGFVELGSSNVWIGPKALLDVVEFRTNGNKATIFD